MSARRRSASRWRSSSSRRRARASTRQPSPISPRTRSGGCGAALGQVDEEDVEEEDPFAEDLYVVFEDEPDEQEDDEDETARLQDEIEESLRTQAALERFIAALDAPAPTEAR